ncbi:phospholipase A [Sphingomonas sp. IC081]|uniref:phospholipase A n=1 Tax=Sphingomonas sp. IC081 TaxID=304378 RepID=UPI0021AFFD1D|nr:phospholipase A [Sphingomonas sp. IC081]
MKLTRTLRRSASGQRSMRPGRNAAYIFSTLLAVLALCPARAEAAPDILISDVGQIDADGRLCVELRILNGDEQAQIVTLPDRIEARIETHGESRSVWLERAPGTGASLSVPAAGFAPASYRARLAPSADFDHAILSIPAWSGRGVAIALRPSSETTGPVAMETAAMAEAPQMPQAAPSPADRSVGNSFLSNLSAYEPIYAVYGPGTDSEARIQISFKYQLFGSRQADGLPHSWRDGLHFAYTQRMFWDVSAKSSPFRNIDFQPELFYLTPSATLASGVALSAQAGLRHESNGRDGPDSRSFNTFYIAPMAAFPLGGNYRLTVAPRLSLFIGDKSDNPDIARYRGNGALFVELGDPAGLRLSANGRLNLDSGKGAVAADLSYPLPRLLGGGPDFYLFAQSFAGYGENLLDYDRKVRRVRVGVALVR